MKGNLASIGTYSVTNIFVHTNHNTRSFTQSLLAAGAEFGRAATGSKVTQFASVILYRPDYTPVRLRGFKAVISGDIDQSGQDRKPRPA